MEIKTGIFYNMPEKEYRAIPAMSSTDVKNMMKTNPEYMKLMWEKEFKKTPAMEMGIAAHKLVLEGLDAFNEKYIVSESNDKRYKQYKEDLETAEKLGKELLTANQFSTINLMAQMLKRNKYAVAAMKNGKAEVVYVGKDPETGAYVKCKADFVGNMPNYEDKEYILDYKTTKGDIDLDSYRKHVVNFYYHVQAAHYSRVYEIVTGKKLHSFIHLAQLSAEPYFTNMFEFNEEWIQEGDKVRIIAWNKYVQCLEEDYFPNFVNQEGVEYKPIDLGPVPSYLGNKIYW